MPGPQTSASVTMLDQYGNAHEVPADQVAAAAGAGFRVQTDADVRARLTEAARQDDYGGVAGAIGAGAAAIARGASLGASDVAVAALGGGDTLSGLQEVNPTISTVGEMAGAVAPTLLSGGAGALGSAARLAPAARAAEFGASIGRAAEGAGALAQVGRAAAGAAAEGAIVGVGQGVSELALSEDPLTLERAGAVLSSRALHGAAIGGVVGGAAKGLELGLARAGKALRASAEQRAAASDVPEDLAALDRRGLRVAETSEKEAIEAARVPQREGLADDIAGYRGSTKEAKIWLATKGAEDSGLRQLTKQQLKASRQLDNILDNPKALAERPEAALSALQKEEHALEQLDELRRAIPTGADEVTEGLTTEVRARALKTRGFDEAADEGSAVVAARLKDAEREMRLVSAKARPRRADALEQYEARRAAAEAELAAAKREAAAAQEASAAERAAAKRAVEAGDSAPIRASVTPSGRIAIEEGQHRLTAAIELDKPIRIQWRQGVDDLRGQARRDLQAGRVEGELAPRDPEALERAVDRVMMARHGSLEPPPPTRAAAMRFVEPALQKNRALQARIRELQAAPASARLQAIQDAKDALASAGGPKSLHEEALGQAVGLIPGAGLAAKLLGGLGKAVNAGRTRAEKAAARFLDVSAKTTRSATPIASRVLANVAYAPSKPEQPRAARRGRGSAAPSLAESYRARADEIRSQVESDPATGELRMRQEARAAMAAELAPFALASPVVADHLETMGARRLEFLARKLPRQPDMGLSIGPSRWQPSDMEMRKFARYAAAVEDPDGVADRLVDGTLTTEDAQVMREVYPEQLADITARVLEQLPTLRATLPYARRLSLSILTGQPVDPSMNPRILRVLQAQYAAEPGTNGGTSAPTPQPQFGSVRAEQPTPAQQRQDA